MTPSKAHPMVAIAPTPSLQHQTTADSSTQLQKQEDPTKVALKILQQPPEIWYKDQFGRKATFQVLVQREKTFCDHCTKQRILTVQLLYESGKVVDKQEILHIMAGQCLDRNGQSTLCVRIAEVSKNHLNQRFRLELSVPACPEQCHANSSVVSQPVLVLSKIKKKTTKRTVKEEAETTKLTIAKKAKCSSGIETPKRKEWEEDFRECFPMSTFTNSTVTETSVANGIADITAPFTPTTQNLCLWANAAFDLLYKLQWQRAPVSATNNETSRNLDQLLTQAMSRAYKCPSCNETYGQHPVHRDDCDLKLLLEQSEASEKDKKFEIRTNDNTQTPAPASEKNDTKSCENGSMATHFNITSWRDYASFSKLLHTSLNIEATSPQSRTSAFQWTEKLPSLEPLSTGFPTTSSKSCRNPQSGLLPTSGSQRFSALLSATENLAPDVTDLFRESPVSLDGDGNIVKSLDSMNLSEILRSHSRTIHGNSPRLPSLMSAFLSDELSKLDVKCENDVACVIVSDFQHCGFPAFDTCFTLLGFYQLVNETTKKLPGLSFTPNLFPLPSEMLQELQTTVTKWKKTQSIVYRVQAMESNSEDTLHHLRNAVLRQVTL